MQLVQVAFWLTGTGLALLVGAGFAQLGHFGKIRNALIVWGLALFALGALLGLTLIQP